MQELCAPMHMIEPRTARDSQLHCKSSLPGEIMDTVSTHSLAVNRKDLCVIDECKQRQGFSCHGAQQKLSTIKTIQDPTNLQSRDIKVCPVVLQLQRT